MVTTKVTESNRQSHNGEISIKALPRDSWDRRELDAKWRILFHISAIPRAGHYAYSRGHLFTEPFRCGGQPDRKGRPSREANSQ